MNGAGHEGGVFTMSGYTDLPILQDTVAIDAWSQWGANYRDVLVLDDENRVVAVYNLSQHNLGDAADYAELRDILTAAVAAP